MNHLPGSLEVWTLWLFTFLPSLPLILLILAFTKVLNAKKFEVRTLLESGETLTKYLSAYGGIPKKAVQSEIEPGQAELAQKIVNQVFRLRYSIPEYFWAVLFYVFVNSTLVALGFSFAGLNLGVQVSSAKFGGDPILHCIVAGGIGALVWSVYELCERYRFGDLSPDVVFVSAARVLFVASVGAVVSVFVNDRFAWPVAFGLGVMPVSFARSFIIDKAKTALKLSSPTYVEASPPLSLLQGWNTELSEKLQRAGITSLQELACSNQFHLFLRSNLEWRVLLDLSDQAILLLYLGEKIRKLYPMGVRSAVEIAEFDWSSDDKVFFKEFTRQEAVQKIAEALEMDMLEVNLLIKSISQDATVNFLGALWSETTPEDDDDEDAGDEGGPSQEGGSAPSAA